MWQQGIFSLSWAFDMSTTSKSVSAMYNWLMVDLQMFKNIGVVWLIPITLLMNNNPDLARTICENVPH